MQELDRRNLGVIRKGTMAPENVSQILSNGEGSHREENKPSRKLPVVAPGEISFRVPVRIIWLSGAGSEVQPGEQEDEDCEPSVAYR